MKSLRKALLGGAIAISVSVGFVAVYGGQARTNYALLPPQLALPEDTTKLPYKISKTGEKKQSVDLRTPPSLERQVELDSTMDHYKVSTKVGDELIGSPEYVPFDEYLEQQNQDYIQDYFKRRSQAQNTVQGRSILPELDLGEGILDDIVGAVDIRPQGSAELIFSEDISRVQNPNWSLREQRNAQFKFDQKIQVSVIGSIGDRFKMAINFDTEATFDFENQRKINYVGKEDEIIRSIEVGDVSMPVSGSLISGSQSLFGFKTQLQFGKLDVTGVFSQQKSEKKVIEMEDGAQRTEFDIPALEYDNDRHFFLAQYFREHYNEFNRNWPALSNIQVTRVEVWVMNTTVAPQNTRSVVGFIDLGEKDPYNNNININAGSPAYPSNTANNLYEMLTGNKDFRYQNTFSNTINASGNFENTIDYFELSNARMLAPNDYYVNSKLGYISLNTRLNQNEVLAVAFEYTVNGVRYQVGEFARDVPPDNNNNNVLFLKLLKTMGYRPDLPIWDLMMKNVYNLGAYQVSPEDFRLQVVYANDKGVDLNYLPVPSESELNGKPLIRVLDLDRFNSQEELKPDGSFDYLEGVTIVSTNGRVIFPVLEPFGDYLYSKFDNKDLASQYVYQQLYDSTPALAQQEASKNKFFLRGSYQGSSGAVISLNAINVPQNSVRVTAGGIPLVEGVDYTVDYTLGRVTIINNSILNSGAVIKVEAETNNLFNIQQKTLMGTRLNYNFTKDIALGGTLLYLRERPLTPKVNIGDEPIRNMIWGLDGRFRTDSRFLTKLVDKAPLLETKEMSEVSFEGEFAQIVPGHPKTLNDPLGQGGGVSYLDDFEGSIAPYDLRLDNSWALAAVPQGQPDKFPEANNDQTRPYNFGRAKLSWYIIDNIFHQESNLTPANVRGNTTMLSNNYMREVYEWEVFPNRQIPSGSPGLLRTFDVAYRPAERGPYNYAVDRLEPDGTFIDPQNSWAGITRSIQLTDFEASNVEYVTFWVMDPYINNPTSGGGNMYINLGTISEDILHDNKKLWENGLPATPEGIAVDSSQWGRLPNKPQINRAFDIDPEARPYQDVGYDGLTDGAEQVFFNDYLQQLQAKLDPAVYANFAEDPSADNFHFFRGQDLDAASADILQRYKDFNNPHGNTPTSIGDDNGYGSQYPDDEDINGDFNLEKTEAYFEYQISLRPQDMVVGKNYITDIQEAPVQLRNQQTAQVKWYQFKVPVKQYSKKIGGISDFRNIRFMRMYFKDFADSVILRFGQLQLVRGDWRKYTGDMRQPGDWMPDDTGNTTFDVAAVNIEENGKRPGIPYVLPPGIQREVDYSTPNLVQQNEQSLSLQICNLEDGDARAIFKNLNYDIRQYKNLKMFVHAESENNALSNGDLRLFIRIGTDYNSNYYEYEMPLTFTRSPAFERDDIWPEANRIDVRLEEFYEVKKAKMNSGVEFSEPFTRPLSGGDGNITVVGNPDLSNVRSVMIGIRNPKDDGIPTSCAEIWVNELRVTEFNEKGGWAATGRMTTKLADFGRLELTGTRRTIGFGQLEQTLQERSLEDSRYYGLISTFQLGNFFPKNFNIKIPMLFSYSEQIDRPRYNPLSPDLPLNSIKDIYDDPGVQDSILEAAEDFTSRTSLNFTGVQKLRGPNQKSHFYDVENLNATYVFSKINRHNIYDIYAIEKQHVGQLGYAYNFKAKPVQPFKNLKGSYLRPISDFNFYYLPQSVTVRGELNRWYAERLFRPADNIQTVTEPLYDKNFTFNRFYDLRHNLTKGLRLTYSAKANSRIQEPYGPVDKAAKDTIWQNLKKLGDLTAFDQQIQAAYDVPINKIPLLDWTTMQTSYTAGYQWNNAPPAAPYLGNTVQNSQTINVVNQFNFVNLYRKIPGLKNLQGSSGPQLGPRTPASEDDTTAEEKEGMGAKAGKAALGLITMLKNASFNYTLNNGTLLPGFDPTPDAFGQDLSEAAPGLPFILGSQRDMRQTAVDKGWLSTDTNMTTPYLETHREDIKAKLQLEPIKAFRINVDLNKQKTNTFTENWRAVDAAGNFAHLSPVESGSYTISYLPIKTAFGGAGGPDATFNQFSANRRQVADRLAGENPLWAGARDTASFPAGYSKYNQDVLIPAFLAAYTGNDPSGVALTPFPKIPFPNWNVSYTGLSNLKFIQSFARTVNITHGYRSTYSVDQFSTALDYNPNEVPSVDKDLVSQYRIERIALVERFEPLIGFDINWVNNITSRLEYRKDRSVSLSFADKRLSEIRGKELSIRIGYRTSKVYLPFKVNRQKVFLENDLQFNMDMSIRDNIQVIRLLDQVVDEETAFGGQRVFSLTPNINYVLSKNLTLNIFFKRTSTRPYTSNQFPTSLTSFGFSLRYVLSP